MTEQEIRQIIEDCDRQIVTTYANLIVVARYVGSSASQAAESERQSVVSEASGRRMAGTVFPLLIALVGLFVIRGAMYWGLPASIIGMIMSIGGFVIAYKTYKRTSDELVNIEAESNSMVGITQEQLVLLNTTIDNNINV